MDITNVAPEIFEKVSAAGVRQWLLVNTLTNTELLKLVKSTQTGPGAYSIELQTVDPAA